MFFAFQWNNSFIGLEALFSYSHNISDTEPWWTPLLKHPHKWDIGPFWEPCASYLALELPLLSFKFSPLFLFFFLNLRLILLLPLVLLQLCPPPPPAVWSRLLIYHHPSPQDILPFPASPLLFLPPSLLTTLPFPPPTSASSPCWRDLRPHIMPFFRFSPSWI